MPTILVVDDNPQAREILRRRLEPAGYQVAEARAWGADCILIIMAAVTDDEARALMDEARRWKIDTLVEIHNEAELERALFLGPDLIGINNRDLKTFVTDIAVTLRLAPLLPPGNLIVAESGLGDPARTSRRRRETVLPAPTNAE